MPVKKRESRDQKSTEPRAPRKRVCLYCENKTEPTYTDTVSLRRFVSDRSKIIPRMRSGACSKHQRRIAREVKYARHLSLLPFITRVS